MNELNDRKKVIRLATEIMGWGAVKGKHPLTGSFMPDVLVFDCGNDFFHTYPLTWNPPESISDAMEMQAKVPEELRDDYAAHLADIVRNYNVTSVERELWLVANATARQRFDAAIAVLEAQCRKS